MTDDDCLFIRGKFNILSRYIMVKRKKDQLQYVLDTTSLISFCSSLLDRKRISTSGRSFSFLAMHHRSYLHHWLFLDHLPNNEK